MNYLTTAKCFFVDLGCKVEYKEKQENGLSVSQRMLHYARISCAHPIWEDGFDKGIN